jgi:hypothetical protein
MMLPALESTLRQIETTYVPVGMEHDPRLPPQGRMARAQIVPLGDGHFALDGEFEIFETGDEIALEPSPREIPIHRISPSGASLVFDRHLRSAADQEDLSAIAGCIGCVAEEVGKTALDPLSILTIAVSSAIGTIATGLHRRLGDVAYTTMKARLKSLCERKQSEPRETLLRLILVVKDIDRYVQLEIIATMPEPEDIDALFGPCLQEPETALPGLLAAGQDLRRFVFEYSSGSLFFKFAVRRDAVPLYPARG